MDSNQKPLPSSSSSPPPPPPPPPKNGNIRGRPPLLSANKHDERDGGTVGVGDMEVAALCRGSRSGRRLEGGASSRGETKMPRGSLVGCPSRDEDTTEQHGLPLRHSRVVARLGFAGLGIVAAVDDQPYTCADCSMTFGRETALCGHMRSHKRDLLSSESEEDAPTPKRRRRKKQKASLKTVKPLEATWGNTECRNGYPKDAPSEIQRDDNHVIVIDDDDDVNLVIAVAGSRGSPGPTPDAAAALAMTLAPEVDMATPMAAPHAAATSVNIEGAPAAASTTAVSIPPARAPVAAATITRAPLATSVSVATQTASELVKWDNGSGQAGAIYRYGYAGKGLAGCSSGSHTYNTSTAAGGESNKGCGKVYSCHECKNKFFHTPQALGGHVSSHHRIREKKGDKKLDLQSGLHKCKVCNHLCQTVEELNFHMMCVHPHTAVATAASAIKEKTFEATGINNIGAAVDDPYNTMGWRIPAGAPRNVIIRFLASMAPVHQPPQGTMAMAGNPMTGHFSLANTPTSWSLPGTTSSILPRIPLHTQEQNPPEQITVVAPGNQGHHSINPALFSFSRRQEMSWVPSNAIASSSSTPHSGIAVATEPSQGINNNFATIDAPVNSMGHRLPFFLAGRSNTQALPVSWLMHHPTHGMTLDGNPLTGHFPAISATCWSFPATTSSVLPSIPSQNQEEGCRSFNPTLFSKRQEENLQEEIAMGPSNAINSSTTTPHPGGAAASEHCQALSEVNNNAAATDSLANTMRRLPFFLTGRSALHDPLVSMPVHQPTQGMAAIVGNLVTGHFSAAMAGNDCSVPATTSSVFPAIPLQNQEDNPPQGRVVPTHELADPSQNQAENPPEETVSGNNRGHTILLFGTNIVEGHKEVKEPTN